MNEHSKFVKRLGNIYQHKFNQDEFLNYFEIFSEYNIEELEAALKKHRVTDVSNFIPSPGKLIAHISHKIDPRTASNEVAGRIYQAIGQFGYTNEFEAKEFIGQLGWRIVERDGGWPNVCANSDLKNKGIQKAQWRDMALSIIDQAHSGFLDMPIPIPRPSRSGTKRLDMFQILKND